MSELHAKIDWLAFTFPIALLGDKDEEWTLAHILGMFREHTSARLDEVLGSALWEFSESSGFYSHSITHPIIHCRINWRAGNPHAQAVFSGQACEMVLQSITSAAFLSLSNGRCTRLDIAIDIETSVAPADFVAAGYSERILSHSSLVSPSGSTEYVGSRNGERMARVYRYNPPHPRANLLRIEVELKGDAAKMACEYSARMSLNELALSTNLTFDWKHPIWNTDKLMVSKIPARSYDREGAETLKWLNDVVAPAIMKAHRSGLIDFFKWMDTHFPVNKML